MFIQPIYDTKRNCWWVEHAGKMFSAPTIRELKTKLPKVEVLDYYPNGYQAARKAVKIDVGEQLRQFDRAEQYKYGSSWTQEELQLLKQYADQGMLAAEIAIRLNRTRNAVIGQCNRRGYQLQHKAVNFQQRWDKKL